LHANPDRLKLINLSVAVRLGVNYIAAIVVVIVDIDIGVLEDGWTFVKVLP
jgi:hypothetical protein